MNTAPTDGVVCSGENEGNSQSDNAVVSSSFKLCLLILFVAPGQNKGRSLRKVTFVTFAKTKK